MWVMSNTIDWSLQKKLLFAAIIFSSLLSLYFYGYSLLIKNDIFTLAYEYKLNGTPWGPPVVLRRMEIVCTLDNQLQNASLMKFWIIPKYLEERYWLEKIKAGNGLPFFANENGAIEF